MHYTVVIPCGKGKGYNPRVPRILVPLPALESQIHVLAQFPSQMEMCSDQRDSYSQVWSRLEMVQ